MASSAGSNTDIRTIAVCAAQVPFFSGGAEAHVGGLISQLRQRGFEVDLISLPFKWYPESQLMRSIQMWQKVDLTESNGKKIDLVIATKFPSYFVQHPRKVLWLIHQYRQMYDLLGTPHSPYDVSKFRDRRFRNKFVKLDTRALASYPRRYTNARNTAQRLRTHCGLSAEALYHPPPLMGRYTNIAYENYVVSVGRLDQLKRIDCLLRALPHMDASIHAKIAGTGPEREKLEALAAELGVQDRVDFLGFVPDDEVVALYGNASAVYFAPHDEDYGYITLEAFLSGKPVITAPDSGGPLEFVQHGVNGLVLDCLNAEVLGANIQELVLDKKRCAEMGAVGAESIADISWENVINTLIRDV